MRNTIDLTFNRTSAHILSEALTEFTDNLDGAIDAVDENETTAGLRRKLVRAQAILGVVDAFIAEADTGE